MDGPVVDIDGYSYFVDPLSDGIPRVDPEDLKEAAEGLAGIAGTDYDVILAPEAMGIPLATVLSMRVGVPFTVARKRRYGLPGEIEVRQTTGYSEATLFVNGIGEGDRALIVDDVVDTGGTVRGLAESIRAAGAVVSGIVTIYDRNHDLESLSESIGAPVRSLLRVDVVDGRPVVL